MITSESKEITKAPVIGETQAWPQLSLTAVQKQMWTETRTALLWSQPAFSDIWYSMMLGGDGETAWFTDNEACPTAATDDQYMYLNPNAFFSFKLEERVFIACHEILHAMFGHCTQMYNIAQRGWISYPDGRMLPFDNDQFQVAMDLVINAILVESNVGAMPQKDGRQFGHWDPNVVPHTMGVLDAYRKIYKKPDPNGGKGRSPGKGGTGPGEAPKGFDSHLTPGQGKGQNPSEAQANRNQSAWNTAIAAAIASAKLQGNMPLGLERLFGKMMQPEVDWTDLLRSCLNRKLGNSGGSWETLEQSLVIRGIGAPGRVSYGAGLIIVAVDTSGSITQPMMDRFMSEVGGILDDVRPRELILVQCDAAVHEWVECDDSADLKRKILGGGGTSFVPVFERIASEGITPDAMIYFTDGYGKFPSQPHFPVIWGNITKDYEAGYPWGEVVFVPLKGM